MAQFTIPDILHCLDSQSVDEGFPAFSNCNIDMVTARLRGLRNENSWMIMFEQLVNSYPAEGILPILLIDVLGNCFENKKSWVKESLYPVKIENECEWESKQTEHDNDDLLYLMIREQQITVKYKSIEKHSHWNLGFNLLVHLLANHREEMLATEDEIRAIVPSDIQQVILLDNWHHPDVCGWNGRKNRHFIPSDAMSMRMIAQVLETENIDFYQPCEEANIDWRFWMKVKNNL
jgi:hypothetical protein